MVERVAVLGERCPQSQPHGPFTPTESRALLDLARAGRLRIEIFPHNWRVVTICEGPNKGRSTLRSPLGKRPYLTIRKGDLIGNRPQPSAPQLLAYAGRE